MRKSLVLLTLLAIALSGLPSVEAQQSVPNGRYRVVVTRVAQNAYRDGRSDHVILTRYCYVYAYAEEGLLIWEGQYGNSRLIFFDSREECNVEDVI